MSREAKPISADYDFAVESVPVYIKHQGEFIRTGDYANQRQDTGARVGITSDKYGIVQNGNLLRMVKETFGNMKLGNYKEKTFVCDEGKRFYGQFDFPNQLRAASPVVGDDVSLRLTVRNSYDRSCRANVAIGMMRLVCTNGMTSLRKAADLNVRHSSSVSIASIRDGLKSAVGMFDQSVKDLATMRNRKISHDQGVLILNNLAQKAYLTETLKDSVEMVWNSPRKEDEERNIYNLYNACTQHLTHVSGSRFEYSGKRSDACLKALHRVASEGKYFDTMIIPVEKEAKVVKS